MAGREVYENMSSSQHLEVCYQAKIRKLRKQLEETERMRKKGLERREKARRAKGSVEEMREIRKPGDQTAGSQKEGNGENQFPEELGKERDAHGSKRADERWKATLESKVEKKVGRRIRARETSEDMTDDKDELASNPQQQERHKGPREHGMHHQPDKRRTMGHPRERRGGSYYMEAWEGRGRTREKSITLK